MSEEKVLLNVTKSESNVNVSIANTVLSWLATLIKGEQKDENKKV